MSLFLMSHVNNLFNVFFTVLLPLPIDPKIPKLVSCKSAENESKTNLISIIEPSITGEEFLPEQEMRPNIIPEKN